MNRFEWKQISGGADHPAAKSRGTSVRICPDCKGQGLIQQTHVCDDCCGRGTVDMNPPDVSNMMAQALARDSYVMIAAYKLTANAPRVTCQTCKGTGKAIARHQCPSCGGSGQIRG